MSQRKREMVVVAVVLVAVVAVCLGAVVAAAEVSGAESEGGVGWDGDGENNETTAHLLPLNVSRYPGERCNRACVAGQRRLCYFHFTLEHYQAMGAACGKCARGVAADCERPQCIVGDGVEKGVMSINRQIPGPALHVCQHDLVVVDVANRALGTAASLHWHGLHMRQTPFMDGVPFVTQCPVPFATTFRYQFAASEAGTHFYHSHSGHHKVNGQYGALIVRQPVGQTAQGALYDHDLPEHHILISDWMHSYGEQCFPGLPSGDGILPDSVLINGRGVYLDRDSGEPSVGQVPPMRYHVTPGKRYRFRLINSVSNACPFQLQIEDHNLTIIAADGNDVEPLTVQTLVSNSGERYDFVLEANGAGAGSGDGDGADFWIRVRGLGLCGAHPIEAYALLRYRNNEKVAARPVAARPVPALPTYRDVLPSGTYFNHPNGTCFGRNGHHCLAELRALEQDELLRTAQPDHKFFLAFNNHPVPNSELFQAGRYYHFSNLQANLTVAGAINNLSFVFPDSPPLTQPDELDERQFCDYFKWPPECGSQRLCACVHRLRVRLGSIVELIIVDESERVGPMHHPFHLHGYRFLVTGVGHQPPGEPMTVSRAKQMERDRLLRRHHNNTRPPFKDTVTIPSRGYAILRFRADNPGFWLMHCHYEWHMAIGMALIMQAGTAAQMPAPPPSFPRCGNYLPPVRPPTGGVAKE